MQEYSIPLFILLAKTTDGRLLRIDAPLLHLDDVVPEHVKFYPQRL